MRRQFNIVVAYIWWSVFTILVPSLFYFSVWQLAIAGQEISITATLSPILLGSPSIFPVLESQKGRIWLQGLCLFGLSGYIIEFPLLRLLVVTIANVSGSLLKALEWSKPSDATRNGLGMHLFLKLLDAGFRIPLSSYARANYVGTIKIRQPYS